MIIVIWFKNHNSRIITKLIFDFMRFIFLIYFRIFFTLFNRYSNLKLFVVSRFHLCLWNEKEGKNQHIVFCLYLWRTCMLLICTCAKSFKKHNGMKKDVHLLSITNDFWNDSLRWLYKRFTCYSKIRISAEMILNRAKTSQQFSKSKNLQKARKEETWRHAQSLWQNFRISKPNWCFFFHFVKKSFKSL